MNITDFQDREIVNQPLFALPQIETQPLPISEMVQNASTCISLDRHDSYSELDLIKLKLQKAQITDATGVVFDEIIAKEKISGISINESLTLIVLFETAIELENGNTYTPLEFYQFIIEEASKLDFEITSIFMIGGGLPYLFSDCYISNLNTLYKRKCMQLGIIDNDNLITKEVADDFNRVPPDYDFLVVVKDKGELRLLNKLVTQFFAAKMPEKDLTYFTQKSSGEKKGFFREFANSGIFSLSTFGPCAFIIDNSFVFENHKNILFTHHGMKLSILPFIKSLKVQEKQYNRLLLHNNLLPEIPLEGNWQSLCDRATKEISLVNITTVNNRGWAALISNRKDGYTYRQLGLPNMLLNKVDGDPLIFLEKRWEVHDKKQRVALISMGLNAIISLLENPTHSPHAREYWHQMMGWCEQEKMDKINTPESLLNDKSATFYLNLKETLDNKTTSLPALSAFLQLYASLKTCSPQSTSAIKCHLRGTGLSNREISILQKIDTNNYAIFIPFNLFDALETLLKLDSIQLDNFDILIENLSPQHPYDRALIPGELTCEKLINRVVTKCFDQAHRSLMRAGYELLIIYALHNPQQWILKSLVSNLPAAMGSIKKEQQPLLLANLENVLKGCLGNIEDQKLIQTMLGFCHSQKESTRHPISELSIAIGSIQDHELTPIAINLYRSVQTELEIGERIRFIKCLLPGKVCEATHLFLTMQKEQVLSRKEEIELFITIAKTTRRAVKGSSLPSHLLNLADCADLLLRKHNGVNEDRPFLDHVGWIIESISDLELLTKTTEPLNVRQVSLLIAKAHLNVKLPYEAQPWILRILKTAAPITPSEVSSSCPYLSLLTLEILPNPPQAVAILATLDKDELDAVMELTEQLPLSDSGELILDKSKYERQAIINIAKKALISQHPMLKGIGFKLLISCAATFTIPHDTTNEEENHSATNLPIVDPALLSALLGTFPFILSSAKKVSGTRAIDSVEKLLQYFYPPEIVESFISHFSTLAFETCDLKQLYQTNCVALASTGYAPLCQVGQMLIHQNRIKSLGLKVNEEEHLEIALAFTIALLPGHVKLAEESLQTIEKEIPLFNKLETSSKNSSLLSKKKNLFIAFIDELINQNAVENAKELLTRCSQKKITPYNELVTSQLWVKLLAKMLHHPSMGPKATAECLHDVHSRGGLIKTHSRDLQIELMTDLIVKLLALNEKSTDDSAHEVLLKLRILKPNVEQSAQFALQIENLVQQQLRIEPEQKVDEKTLMRSFQLYNGQDWQTAIGRHVDYAMFAKLWLRAVQHNGDDRHHLQCSHLLGFLLKNVQNRQLPITENANEEMLEIYQSLVPTLKAINDDKLPIPPVLKSPLIASHPKLIEMLKATSEHTLCFEYLDALLKFTFEEELLISLNHQALWVTDQLLKEHSKNILQLQKIHNLLSSSSKKIKLSTSAIDAEEAATIQELATALLSVHLHSPAQIWIDMTMHLQEEGLILHDVNLSSQLIAWCHTLLKMQESQSCLTLLTALDKSQNQCDKKILAPVCFEVSSSIKSPSLSVNLLNDKWAILADNIPSKELQEHLNETLQQMPTDVDQKTLLNYISLLSLQQVHPTEVWIHQFNICCQSIDKMKGDGLETSISQALGSLKATFFSSITIAKDHKNTFEKLVVIRFTMIKILLDSDHPALFQLGCSQIHDHIIFLITKDLLKSPEKWSVLLDGALRKKNLLKGNTTISIRKLIDAQLVILNIISPTGLCELGKNLCLIRLEDSIGTAHNENMTRDLKHFASKLEYFKNDQQSLHDGLKLAIDALVTSSLAFDEEKIFQSLFRTLHFAVNSLQISEIKPKAVNIFYMEFAKRCLMNNLEDKVIKAKLINESGSVLEKLIEYNSTRINLEKTFFPIEITPQILEDRKIVNEIIQLTENFFFLPPILVNADKVIALSKNDEPRLIDLRDSYKSIENKLRSWGYVKTHSKQAFKFQILINENPEIDLEKNHAVVLEMITHGVNHMINQKYVYCHVQALKIIQITPSVLWKKHPINLKALLLKIIDQKTLYPNYISNICTSIELLDKENARGKTPNWSKIYTEIAIHFYKKMQVYNVFEIEKINLNEIQEDSICNAVFFLPNCMHTGNFDTGSHEFASLFDGHLSAMIKLINGNKIYKQTFREALSPFIRDSLVMYAATSKDNRALYCQKIGAQMDKLMFWEDEDLEENLNIIMYLFNHNYFTKRTKTFFDVLDKCILQLDKRCDNTELKRNKAFPVQVITTLIELGPQSTSEEKRRSKGSTEKLKLCVKKFKSV